MLDDLGDSLVEHIREKVQEGQELRVTFDNFDFQVLANIIVKGHQNSDMHWTGSHSLLPLTECLAKVLMIQDQS